MAMGDLTGIGFNSYCGGGGEVTLSSFIDSEFICDNDTNTWFRIVNQIDAATGTVTQLSSTDTGVSCDDPAPGEASRTLQVVLECRADEVWRVTYQVDPDGTTTELAATNTALACAAETPDICSKCYVDDTLNDGTVLVNFTRRSRIEIDPDTGVLTETVLGDFDSNEAPYVVVGTASPCAEIGVAASRTIPRRVTLNGPALWPDLASNVGQYVTALAFTAISQNSTVTDETGTSTLHAGETNGWEADNDSTLPLTPLPTLDVPAGGIATVWWTELGF